MSKTFGYLRLMRPANIVTSVADVLAGIAISGFFTNSNWMETGSMSVLLLCVSTAALYAGGIVYNDVFDTELDRVERPERPIPSGLIAYRNAAILGGMLLAAGILAGLFVNTSSGLLAVLITISALVYNKWGKHLNIIGPLNMGLCRGLNILLGISILPDIVLSWWYIALVPILYIASITMISRGEVHGSNRNPLYFAAFLYAIVITAILYFAFISGMMLIASAFLIIFSWMIYKPLLEAIKEPTGKNIGKAVKAGVISLIVMNAAWAAASGTIVTAFFIFLLLPLSIWLSKLFAVT